MTTDIRYTQMNEERRPPIGSLDSLFSVVVFLLYFNITYK